MAAALDFRILGPLEVRCDGRPVALGGARQRGVLALLLLHANQPVSSDRLIDELWRENPPKDASAALQAHVSRLRRLLAAEREGEEQPIETAPSGYRLRVAPEALDLMRFEALVADGTRLLEDGDAAAASTCLRGALELWRGRPLADLEGESFAQEPVRDLEERWLAAVETRIDADLELGRHADLLSELTPLARHHSVRERFHGQLMLALYRSGRQAEALETYAQLRRTLVEEHGLEPSPTVRALQAAILGQDPGLLLSRRERRPGPPRHRRLRVVLMAAAAAAAAALAAFVIAGPEEDQAAVVSPSAGSVAMVALDDGRIVTRVAVGATPSALAAADGRVWVVNADDQTITRIDARTRAAETFGVGATPTDVTAGGGAVWVGSGGRQRRAQAAGLLATGVVRLDPETHAPRATVALPRSGRSWRTRSPTISPRARRGSGPSPPTDGCSGSTRRPTASRPRSPACAPERSRWAEAASGRSRRTAV